MRPFLSYPFMELFAFNADNKMHPKKNLNEQNQMNEIFRMSNFEHLIE